MRPFSKKEERILYFVDGIDMHAKRIVGIAQSIRQGAAEGDSDFVYASLNSIISNVLLMNVKTDRLREEIE